MEGLWRWRGCGGGGVVEVGLWRCNGFSVHHTQHPLLNNTSMALISLSYGGP